MLVPYYQQFCNAINDRINYKLLLKCSYYGICLYEAM